MKVIVAGSRGISDQAIVDQAVLESGFQISEVVSGTARGVDRMGEDWANRNKIAIKRFPADWNTHGKAAGPIRNEQMAAYADALIAVWDGSSSGTAHMVRVAKKNGLRVYIKVCNESSQEEGSQASRPSNTAQDSEGV